MDQAEGRISLVPGQETNDGQLMSNKELLVDLLTRIQMSPRGITLEQLTLRLRLMELMHEDVELIEHLSADMKGRAIQAYRNAHAMLEVHKRMLEQDPKLVARVMMLEGDPLMI